VSANNENIAPCTGLRCDVRQSSQKTDVLSNVFLPSNEALCLYCGIDVIGVGERSGRVGRRGIIVHQSG
jgi:hypothetical protein